MTICPTYPCSNRTAVVDSRRHGDAECPRAEREAAAFGLSATFHVEAKFTVQMRENSNSRSVIARSKTTFSRPKADNDPRRRQQWGKGIDSLTTRLHLIAVVLAIATIIANENRLYTSAVVASEHVGPAAIACNRKHREHEGIGRLA